MDRLRMFFAVLALGFVFSQSANAVTVWYQPTPYPLKDGNGVTMEQSIGVVHIHDGWLNSYYSSIKTFQRDEKLKVGGWGDVYRSYINMDLTGLPKDPTNVALWLRFYPSGSATTPFQFCIPNSAWDTTVTWDTQPTFLGCTGMNTTPSTDGWAGWYITSWYQNWQNGVWGKHGIMLNPQYNGNNFDFIRSSRYADYVNDPYADGKRPMLQFDFIPVN
ncbi:MAG: DNRLRE domain-containing protein [Minisyncoccota bacterium]